MQNRSQNDGFPGREDEMATLRALTKLFVYNDDRSEVQRCAATGCCPYEMQTGASSVIEPEFVYSPEVAKRQCRRVAI